MQTISVPYKTSSDEDAVWIADSLRQHACVVRTGYARAGAGADDGSLRPEKELRDDLKARFPDHPLGSWAIHCATREALRLRRQRPDGRMVFGGRKELERRRKRLITHDEWRLRRQSRPIEIIGDRTRWGSRHLRLSEDARTARVEFLGKAVELRLPAMSGKTGILLRALARLTAACEIGVTFSLGRDRLSLTFDPMDLRRLAAGTTLEQVERAERKALGARPRGRPRKDASTHYAAHRVKPIPAEKRPVHPEWRPTIPTLATRAVGVDLNPHWIGLTVVEIGADADARNADDVRVLDHRLFRIDVPIDAPPEAFATHMARAARMATSLARKWSCAAVFHEDGLGKLRWSKRSRGAPATRTINFWSRNALLGGLARRCALGGMILKPVWGGYSSTIGNTLFDLPDACAAAAEIARRGIAASRGHKDRLPAVPQTVHLRRWKDGEVPDAVVQTMAQAGSWPEVHRAIKSAPLGVRRPHPSLVRATGSGTLVHDGRGYAVRPVGSRKGGRLTTAAPVRRRSA